VQQILQSFEHLSEEDKRQILRELLRRSVTLDAPPLSEEQLVRAAEDLFLQVDRSEAGNA
jgi:hypothetical protein